MIIPGQQPKEKPKPLISAAFAESSESDEDAPKFQERKKGVAIKPGMAEARRARLMQEKALEEDPSVFQYDEHFDEMESKRNEVKEAKKKEVKNAKYIGRLLEYSEKRKIENERRIERQVQKEREEEGDEFKDKESFVTSSYRKKLEELKKAEEEEKREEYLESIGDVTKQQNMDGFYRHIYEQKTAEKPDSTLQEAKYVPISSQKTEMKHEVKKRSYRKHHSSDDEKEKDDSKNDESLAKKAHIQSNLDADSDFSIDSSDSEGDDKEKPKAEEPKAIKKEEEPATENKQEDNFKVPAVLEEEKPKPKPKIDKATFWNKRTIGEVFEAALQRYYERKAMRLET